MNSKTKRTAWNKGIPHSVETRAKISLKKKGVTTWNKGKKFSDESKLKMSISHKGRLRPESERKKQSESLKKAYKEGRIKIRRPYVGSENPNWKGGITVIKRGIRHSREYLLWKKAVVARDNYTCIWCGSKDEIQADHIKRFSEHPELRFAIDNGRTLCFPCHRTTATYGRKRL